MPEYLLPCSCGEQSVVSTAQAGETIRCTCGAELHVPTMRGLQELEPLERGTATARASNWDDQHRVAFLLALGALTCLGVAIYLWTLLPVPVMQPTSDDFNVAVDSASTDELFMIHRELVNERVNAPSRRDDTLKTRQMILWGIGIVLALGVAAAGCSAVVLLNRPARGDGVLSKK
jgi:fatty acid desaturase